MFFLSAAFGAHGFGGFVAGGLENPRGERGVSPQGGGLVGDDGEDVLRDLLSDLGIVRPAQRAGVDEAAVVGDERVERGLALPARDEVFEEERRFWSGFAGSGFVQNESPFPLSPRPGEKVTLFLRS